MYMCTCIYMKVIFDNEDEFDKFNVLIYVQEMYLLWLHRFTTMKMLDII